MFQLRYGGENPSEESGGHRGDNDGSLHRLPWVISSLSFQNLMVIAAVWEKKMPRLQVSFDNVSCIAALSGAG